MQSFNDDDDNLDLDRVLEVEGLVDGDDGRDPWVIVEGGIVQNDPTIPVFNLDALESELIDEESVNEVNNLCQKLQAKLVDTISQRQKTALQYHIDRCNAWLMVS